MGQFTGENAVLNPEMSDGWYEREYKIIQISKAFSAYNGIHKWWAPNDNSTCIKVEIGDKPLFETEILKPYFEMTLNELYGKDADAHGYWRLTANPKIWSFADIKIGEEQNYTLYNENGRMRRWS